MRWVESTVNPWAISVIACRVVYEEMLPLLPPEADCHVLDYGLHANPDQLREAIQERIDAMEDREGTLLLGYGCCSRSVVGLRSQKRTLIVPCIDDCIGLFLGARETYLEQLGQEPGTYFLTKGWIEAGDNPFGLYKEMLERYGPEKAEELVREMLKNYRRLLFINTGQYEVASYRDYSKQLASRYGLRFEEVQGSRRWVEKLVFGPWDGEFVIAKPGETISYEAFYLNPSWRLRDETRTLCPEGSG